MEDGVTWALLGDCVAHVQGKTQEILDDVPIWWKMMHVFVINCDFHKASLPVMDKWQVKTDIDDSDDLFMKTQQSLPATDIFLLMTFSSVTSR